MIFNIIRKHGIPYFLGKSIPGLIGIISVPVFVRLYGFEQYGQIILFLTAANMVTVFSCGWLGQSWIRFQPTKHNLGEIKKASLLAILIGLLFGTFSMLFMYLTDFSFNGKFYFPLIVYYVVIVAMIIFYIVHSGLQAVFQSKAVMKISIFLSSFSFVFPVSMYFFNESISAFLLAYGIAYFMAAFIGIGILLRSLPEQYTTQQSTYGWLKYGFPLAIWMTLQAGIPYIQRVLIKQFLGFEYVGKFSALSELIIRAFSLLVFPLTMALQPILMKLWNQNKKLDAIKLWRKSLHILLWVFCFIGLLFLGVNGWIVDFTLSILGVTLKQPLFVISLLSLSGFIWQSNLLLHKPIELQKETIKMVGAMIISIGIIIILNILWLNQFQLVGAAGAASIGAIVYTVIVGMYNRKILQQIGYKKP